MPGPAFARPPRYRVHRPPEPVATRKGSEYTAHARRLDQDSRPKQIRNRSCAFSCNRDSVLAFCGSRELSRRQQERVPLFRLR
jgi:hypothetical protein